jgi:hypothetical protein
MLGVDFNANTGEIAFLILDPHYTGEDRVEKCAPLALHRLLCQLLCMATARISAVRIASVDAAFAANVAACCGVMLPSCIQCPEKERTWLRARCVRMAAGGLFRPDIVLQFVLPPTAGNLLSVMQWLR